MSFFGKITKFFNSSKELNDSIKNGEIQEGETVVLDERESGELSKFDAEFHNPRLICFYCQEKINSGKLRFFKAPGQATEQAYHKRCFKKLKNGRLPGV